MANVIVGCKLPNGIQLKVGGKSVTLNGANSSRIIGGYGLTPVDKDFFAEWQAQYADYGPLKNGLIFAEDSANKAEGKASEQEEVKSGLEPIDQSKLAGVKPVEKDD